MARKRVTPRKPSTKPSLKFPETVSEADESEYDNTSVCDTVLTLDTAMLDNIPDNVLDILAYAAANRKPKNIITEDTLTEGFSDIIAMITEEMQRIRDDGTIKQKNLVFLRTLNKKLRILRTQTTRLFNRVSKQIKLKRRSANPNAGFKKPYYISRELAKFTGWNEDEKKSRVDVTRFFCNYIKENGLQLSTNRQLIVPDMKIRRLFDYQKPEPFKFVHFQCLITKHLLKEPEL